MLDSTTPGYGNNLSNKDVASFAFFVKLVNSFHSSSPSAERDKKNLFELDEYFQIWFLAVRKLESIYKFDEV